MKKKVLFFYGKSLENNDFKVIKEFEKDELVFVGITELKQARTVFSKFIENELSSVRTLRFIYQKIVRMSRQISIVFGFIITNRFARMIRGNIYPNCAEI